MAFFGSGEFGVPILDRLVAMPGVEVVAVVSVPDRPRGRSGRPVPPPVAARARGLGLPLLQPDRLRSDDTLAAIRTLDLDAAVLADYGRLVPGSLLGIPRHGFLNVHPSALPRHRGATPIQATILAGDRDAGVTLFEMDEGLDTGPVVASETWPLSGDETAQDLETAAADRGAALLRQTLGPWLAGRRPPAPQATEGVTLTRPFRRSDGRLDPALAAEDLARRVRALTPWPGAFLETGTDRILVFRAAAGRLRPGGPPGTLVADGDGLALATADGQLRLLEVRPAGGRTMSGEDLRRGRPHLVGAAVMGGSHS